MADLVEDRYAAHFLKHTGNVAKPVRTAFGALIIIKEKCGFSDEQQIMDYPYLQYFIGLTEIQTTPPFDSSSMVHFCKRLDSKMMASLVKLCAREKRARIIMILTNEPPNKDMYKMQDV
jgi:IS5 family transposase